MTGCCAFGCNNRHSDGKKFFSIPSGKHDTARRKVWLHRIGRAKFKSTHATRLCEAMQRTTVRLLLHRNTLQLLQRLCRMSTLLHVATRMASCRTAHGRTRKLLRHSMQDSMAPRCCWQPQLMSNALYRTTSMGCAAPSHTATAVQDVNSPPRADSDGQLPHCSWQDPQAPASLDARLDGPQMLLAAAAHVECTASTLSEASTHDRDKDSDVDGK
ncbi:hypothetical protein HPB47_012420 [Ixodes persulcatus]|uniref:Uncharacterized protein n=1 Tax=Ixodes persulcatus TaxID=34615 RepID=A0AC60NTJ2_IXOPE|nr:hypothetical protein HPB47_012420 [Ixodes persulcatus]